VSEPEAKPGALDWRFGNWGGKIGSNAPYLHIAPLQHGDLGALLQIFSFGFCSIIVLYSSDLGDN